MDVETTARAAREHARLAALRGLGLVDTPPEERFDRITRIAREVFGVPNAAINLIEDEVLFTKSPRASATYPRAGSFCDHAIQSAELLVVPDAARDPRFSTLPSVTGDRHVRFYAGRPLSVGDDLRVGTLCLYGSEPRELSDDDRALLDEMGTWVERELRETTDRDRATEVQRSLFPLNHVGGDEYDIVGVCIPSRGVSGDFYAWDYTAAGLEFTLADVMGKGAGAAILASAVRSAFQSRVGRPVATAVQEVGDQLAADLDAAASFVTLVHGRYDPRTGNLDYADAGQGLSIVVRADGSTERLESTGMPLGVAPSLGVTEASVTLEPGDIFVSSTDGVLDLFDGTLASLDDVAGLVTRTSSAQDVADRITQAAASGPASADDVTVIVLRRHRR